MWLLFGCIVLRGAWDFWEREEEEGGGGRDEGGWDGWRELLVLLFIGGGGVSLLWSPFEEKQGFGGAVEQDVGVSERGFIEGDVSIFGFFSGGESTVWKMYKVVYCMENDQ